MAADYERTWQDDSGDLCFEAKLPAFARLGRRFDALKASEQDPGTPEEMDALMEAAQGRIEDLRERFVRPQSPGLAGRPTDPHTDEVLRGRVSDQLRAIRKIAPDLYTMLDRELNASDFLNG